MSNSLPAPIEELLSSLLKRNTKTNGSPGLEPSELASVREWMAEVVSSVLALEAHCEWLENAFGAKLRFTRSRWDEGALEDDVLQPNPAFPHRERLDRETALDVAEVGVGAIADDELPQLLLNPYALRDLADLIHFTLPDIWLDRLGQAGRKLRDRQVLSA